MDIISASYPGSNALGHDMMSSGLVSRAGEITQNAFVDAYVFNQLEGSSEESDKAKTGQEGGKYRRSTDAIPRFEEWATVHPGEICVQKKFDESRYRISMAAETSAPVIACAQCMPEAANAEFFFSGIARSTSVRPYDDGRGPKVDEFFTLAVGGMCTILNNGRDAIRAGDVVEWTFDDDWYMPTAANHFRKHKGPRRILVRAIYSSTGTHTNNRAFGVAKSQANRGDRFDVLLTQF